MNPRFFFPVPRWLGAWTWYCLLVIFLPVELLGQVTVVSGGPVTTESRQIKLIFKLLPNSKPLVGVSGNLEITGAAFRVGEVSRITVADSSTGASILADIKSIEDGGEVF